MMVVLLQYFHLFVTKIANLELHTIKSRPQRVTLSNNLFGGIQYRI